MTTNSRTGRARRAPSLKADSRFQEIPRERVSERIAQKLLKLIASGQLAPGERLPGERQLAEMMNVSRVSVRAALQQLKTQGFVTAVQGGGTRVLAADDDLESALTEMIRVNRENLHDLAEIRASLEAWAARRAAERATPEQLAEIEDALAAMSEPGRPARFKADDDFHFHLAIAKAAGSAVYLHLLSVLGDVLEESFAYHRYSLAATPEDDRRYLDQHRAVCDAIRAGDGDGAEAAMADHLAAVLSSYAEDESEHAGERDRLALQSASGG